MLQIRLFGSLTIQHELANGAGEGLILSGHVAGILAFLALARGRYFSRDELIGAIWEEQREEAVSAGAFNTTLWRLRKQIELPPCRAGARLARDRRGFICLRDDADIQLDIEEFEQQTAAGLKKPLEQLCTKDIEGLKAGVTLYRADILGDFSAEWALREREKQRRTYLNVLGRLLSLCKLRAEYDTGIRYAQMILDCDPLREDIHRELMQLYEQNGQRALALKQFEACRRLLRKELAIPPMKETTALYQHIAEHALHPEQTADSASFNLTLSLTEPEVPLSPHSHIRQQQRWRASINQARQHLAIADEQLQYSLRLFEE